MLCAWCMKNKLSLNVSKCYIVTYTRKMDKVNFNYHIDGQMLTCKQEIKDLGILFDNQLSFISHVNEVCKSASKTLGFVLRNSKHFADPATTEYLFCSLVRSKLEYAAIVWHPIYTCHKLKVESIQRRFLKYLTFRSTGVYPERNTDHASLLSQHNYLSLDTRREVASANFLHGLLHNRIDCPSLLELLGFNIPRVSSRSHATFFTPICRTNVMVKSPVYQMCKNANKHFSDVFFEGRIGRP